MAPEFEPCPVSLVMPTWNRDTLILGSLESVASQSHRPVEVLIVDDGSTDHTRHVVARWAEGSAGEGNLRQVRHAMQLVSMQVSKPNYVTQIDFLRQHYHPHVQPRHVNLESDKECFDATRGCGSRRC